MDKEAIYQLLTERKMFFEVTAHAAVYNMEEVAQLELPYPESEAKNLFLRDDKNQQYYLVTLPAFKRLNLKEFQEQEGTRRLRFASQEDLLRLLHLTPGSVSPLGLLNDDQRKVHFYLDDYFLKEVVRLGVHPNDNTATVWVSALDLVNLIKDYGNPVTVTHL